MVFRTVYQHFTNKLIFNFNASYPILKSSFSSNLLSIILANNEKNLKNLYVKNPLKHNNLSKILLIFMFPTDFEKVFKLMHDIDFINVVAIEYSSFDNSAMYYYYDIIWRNDLCIYKPEAIRCGFYSSAAFIRNNLKTVKTIYKNSNLIFKEKLGNLNRSSIGLLLSNEFPRAQLYSAVEAFGYLGKVLHTFCHSINASLSLMPIMNSMSKENQRHYQQDLETVHFTTAFEYLFYNQSYLDEVQHMSTVMELIPWLIIVPEPTHLAPHKYIFQPFQPTVWCLILLVVVAISLVAKGSFWRNFCDALRTVLSQSYNLNCHRWSPSWHMLLILFGFIMTSWYYALMGSFVTTTLYETPLNSLEGIRKSGMKILTDDNTDALNLHPGISKYKSVFESVPRQQFFRESYWFNKTVGFLEYGDRWEYYYKPRMLHCNHKIFRKTDIVVTHLPIVLFLKDNFILKDKFNGFLDVIRDVGLYQHWTRGAFTEAINYKLKGMPKLDPELEQINHFQFTDQLRFKDFPRVQAIDIPFMKYGLLEIVIGLSISGIIFILECLASLLFDFVKLHPIKIK